MRIGSPKVNVPDLTVPKVSVPLLSTLLACAGMGGVHAQDSVSDTASAAPTTAMEGMAPAPRSQNISMPQPGALNFDVLRNGKSFGSAQFSFAEDGEDLLVTTAIDLRVKVGFVTAFRYRHNTVERWRDGQVQSLTATTLKDGDDLFVTITRTADGLMIEGTNYTGPAPGDLLLTSWWHAGVVDQTQLINTETGAIIDIEVEPLGEETVTANGTPIAAQCHQLSASMSLKLCYDEGDRWVKTAFSARNSDIEYVLISGDGG